MLGKGAKQCLRTMADAAIDTGDTRVQVVMSSLLAAAQDDDRALDELARICSEFSKEMVKDIDSRRSHWSNGYG